MVRRAEKRVMKESASTIQIKRELKQKRANGNEEGNLQKAAICKHWPNYSQKRAAEKTAKANKMNEERRE